MLKLSGLRDHQLAKIIASGTIFFGVFTCTPAQALTLGYADVVLGYFNSGANPAFPNPSDSYGGEFPGGIGYPVPVSPNVVLGDDPGANVNFLSLPTNSYVIVGFLDEVVFDGVGNDIFIQEIGGNGERADVYVSSLLSTNIADFTFLGTAVDNASTGFDLNSIGFTDIVKAVKIIGLDNLGASPGFDVVNVQGLPQSIQPNNVPTPAAVLPVLGGMLAAARRRKKPY